MRRTTTLRAAGAAAGAPVLAVLVPYRAARVLAGASIARVVAVALLAGLLLVPALLLGLSVVAGAVDPRPAPRTEAGLPAPQANMIAAVADGLMSAETPTAPAVARAVAQWLGAGVAAGLLLAGLGALVLRAVVAGGAGGDPRRALRAGAWLVAAAPWTALALTLAAGLLTLARAPAASTPPWLLGATALAIVWTSLSAGLLARDALRSLGLTARPRTTAAALAGALLIWPITWLGLQVAGLALLR
jgi:hypothetical protein